MSYRLKYTIPFASLKNRNYRLEVEENGYTGNATELTPSNDPFVITTNDNTFIYSPLRLSTATLGVVGGDTLQRLFATDWQQYRVTLIMVIKSGSVTTERVMWCGFVRPEEYTQEYNGETFVLDIEAQSAINTLEHIDYKQVSEDGLQFVTIKSLIERAIVAAQARYGSVFLPHTWAIDAASYGANALLRSDCVITEQNFYDEEDKAMTYYEILEEICRFAHLTLCDWMGDLWFVDWDYTDAYDEYRISGNTLTLVKANSMRKKTYKVQDISFMGSDHSLDILGGYNKASIKTSNYCADEKIFPEENFSELKVGYIHEGGFDAYWSTKKGGLSGLFGGEDIHVNKNRHRCMYVIPEKWQPRLYVPTGYEYGTGVKMEHYEVGSRGGYYKKSAEGAYMTIYEEVQEVDVTETMYGRSNGSNTSGHKYGGTRGGTFGNGDNMDSGHSTGATGVALGARRTVYGALMARYCNWTLKEDGSDPISSYSYEDVIFIRVLASGATITGNGTLTPAHDAVAFDPTKYNGLFNYRGNMPVAAYADGAIAISFNCIPINFTSSWAANQGLAHDGYYYSGEVGTIDNELRFTFILRIGNKYWNGTSWQAGACTFSLKSEHIDQAGQFVSLEKNKTLSMPYDGLDGYIVEIPELMTGEVYFSIRDVNYNCAIKNFKIQYQRKDDYTQVDGAEADGNDRIYSNVINGTFISELDTITEKISSYNHDGLSYGKVLVNGNYLMTLYNGVTKEVERPEHLLLRRLVNQYEPTKTKLKQVLLYDPELLPLDLLTDHFQVGKQFIQAGTEISFVDDKAEINMIQFEV